MGAQAMTLLPETMMTTSNTAEALAIPRVLLSGIRWETYQHLLQDYHERGAVHFAFDRGDLEITTITFAHARIQQLFSLLVTIITEVREIDIDCVGAMTLQRPDLACGLEPDVSFYSQHATQVRGKATIDLLVDPPPDLVIIIDLAEPALDKFPMLAALGIPELWHYAEQQVRIWELAGNEYTEAAESKMLIGIPGAALAELVEAGWRMKSTDWLRRVRSWVRSLKIIKPIESLP